MYPDYHVHSCFSDDSNEPVERIIEQAILLGMPILCLTDHHDMDEPNGGFRLDVERYLATMEELRARYADRIEILCGVEVGIDAEMAKTQEVEKFLSGYSFDYVIGSLHYLDGKDPYYRETFDCSDAELFQMYFTELEKSLRTTTGFHTVGHLDYVVRYGREAVSPYSYARYQEVLDAILEEIVRRDLILEVNTCSKQAAQHFFHPHPDILRRFREMGGSRIVLGSDAHRAARLGEGFSAAADLLRTLGFTHLTLVVRDGEKELPL